MHHSSMKVDLSNFFKDERRQSLVFIDSNWQNIKDLQDHIQSLFNLKDLNLLTTDGCFLPPRESIKVLKSAEGLKAFRFVNHDKDTYASTSPVKSTKKRKNRSDEEDIQLNKSDLTLIRSSKRSKNHCTTNWHQIDTEASDVKAEEKKGNAPESSVESKRSKIRTDTFPVIATDDSPKQVTSKNKNQTISPKVPEKTSDLTTVKEEKAPVLLSPVGKSKKSKKKSKAKPHDIPIEKSHVIGLEKDEAHSPFILEHSKDKSLSTSTVVSSETSQLTGAERDDPESTEIPSETSHLTAGEGDGDEHAPKAFTPKKTKCPLPEVIDNAVGGEDETLPRPSISFRCPLLDLDSNIARTFEIPRREPKVQILETIILKPINGRLIPQNDTAKEFAKPLTVNDEAIQLEVNEKKAFSTIMHSDILKEVKVQDESLSASVHDADETPLSKDTIEDYIITPEDKTEAEVTFPDTTKMESTFPANSTLAKDAYPDDTTEAELTLPGDSSVAEEIHPVDTTEAELTDDSTIAEEIHPVDTTEAELTLPDNSTVAEEIHPVITTKADPTLPNDYTAAKENHPLDTTEPEKVRPAVKTYAGVILGEKGVITLIEPKLESKDIKIPPARACADNFISDSDDDVMLVDDTNLDSDSDVESIPDPKDNGALDIIKDLLQSASPLTNLPTRGDTIIFKLQRTKGDTSSKTTEFLAGNCTYVNRRTKTVTVETITCPSGAKRIMSQYVSRLDDSAEELPSLSINLKDMIEAKIVVTTVD
ncbi:coilin [Drosophila rhopaloa]|uniref:Coilin N-terminal domain-containing protein n=1 Tax=Drosophila rhopaloa TaxID=1041015 RepID=A0ABM5GVJ4_DRORH|nr:coilin [Drosophila rhopaloa]